MHLGDFDARRRVVTTPAGDVSYVDVGPDTDDGSVALFVHGVGVNSYLWADVIERVAGERRCVALDLPLHGRTPARDGQDFSLVALARFVAAFCDTLGLERVDLVANDTGGAVAQIFATLSPPRLRTFTLTNCETHDNVPPASFAPTVELARAGAIAPTAPAILADLETARSALLGSALENPEAVPLEVVASFLEPVAGTLERARQFERFLVALRAEDLLAVEPELRDLHVPTLVVWGTGDVTFDVSWAYWLRDTIPGVTEVVELDGARLFFPLERPDALAAQLRRHWAGTRTTAAGRAG
jgi:pimeloyl-ACP methyl ester carboxylesterase